MSDRGYKIRDKNSLYFITFAVVDWIDIFTRFEYCEVLINSLNYCRDRKGLELYCWSLMTNHFHMICSAKEGYDLSNILRDFKKHTSYEITRKIEGSNHESRRNWILEKLREHGSANSNNKVYQLWRNDNHPIELSTNEMIEQRMDYIHNNPVEARIVERAEDYLLSSAGDYHQSRKGFVNISYLY
jgi:putative transposase